MKVVWPLHSCPPVIHSPTVILLMVDLTRGPSEAAIASQFAHTSLGLAKCGVEVLATVGSIAAKVAGVISLLAEVTEAVPAEGCLKVIAGAERGSFVAICAPCRLEAIKAIRG